MEQNTNFVFVKCPECGRALKFKAVPNFREGTITCPHCGVKNKVADAKILTPGQKQTPPSPKIVNTPSKNDVVTTMESKTRIVDEETQRVARGYIKCIQTGEEIELKPGQNTLGRAASTNKASIVFNDPDMYTSRLHATLSFLADSSQPKLHIKDENSANGTFVNGIKIPAGSIVLLKPGTRFRMGRLEFECRVEGNKTSSSHGKYDTDQTMLK